MSLEALLHLFASPRHPLARTPLSDPLDAPFLQPGESPHLTPLAESSSLLLFLPVLIVRLYVMVLPLFTITPGPFALYRVTMIEDVGVFDGFSYAAPAVQRQA